jgi:hypothetical protein
MCNHASPSLCRSLHETRSPDGKLEALEGLRPFNGPGNGRPGAGFSNPGNSFGGSSPQAWGIGGATPGWGAGGKTPGWGGVGGGKTPAWNAGAATPAWNPTARTPNPYAGGAGKTPAWDASARTPNPYTANAGGKTPGWGDGGGGRTPNPYTTGAAPGWASPSGAGTAGGSNGAWGNTSPARTQGSSSSAWGGWGNDSWVGICLWLVTWTVLTRACSGQFQLRRSCCCLSADTRRICVHPCGSGNASAVWGLRRGRERESYAH